MAKKKKKTKLVIISVSGGVAQIVKCPKKVCVSIRDYDNGKDYHELDEEGRKGLNFCEDEDGQIYQEGGDVSYVR